LRFAPGYFRVIVFILGTRWQGGLRGSEDLFMSIICPHCGHAMNAKSIRAGKFKPKCTKCGRVFVLEVGEGPNPSIRTSLPPGEAPSAVFNPDATEASLPSPAVAETTLADPSAAAANNADFSVAPSVVVPPSRPANPSPDQTMALDNTVAPAAISRAGGDSAALEETEAGEAPDDHAPSPRTEKMPAQLGGYQVVRELGRGGMGAVYLARQVSLDRPVALKVMNPQWAKNPNFLVRFTREAYAAAQLVHHNVVQVYDIGEDHGIHYFSMEFVEGQSLGDLVKKEGKLAPEVAAGYLLQAARGLQFAHERGMIHRDIKPDNLMLNTQGVVKVADLGLVRTPGMSEEAVGSSVAALEVPAAQVPTGRSLSSLSGVTLAGQAMGTPSYMAPEQARDASAVDGRADIYSLGCTLYVLLTGQPVFKGRTAMEIMTRHATDPIPRPEAVARDVPRALGDIIQRTLGKRPEDRYAHMGEFIQALEDFLGLQSAKTATNEQHLRVLETSVQAYAGSSLGRLRTLALLGFTGACFLFFVLLLITSWWRLGTFFFALGGSTLLAYFLVRGSAERGYLFRKTRDLLLGSSWLDWLKMIGGAVVLTLGLFFLGLLPWWLLAVTLGVALAFGLYLGVDKRILDQRREPLHKVEQMLKTLRLRGLSEEALQEFVAEFAGDSWEEFFEALFGYEAKIAARARFAGKPRSRHASWREPILAWIEGVQKARQEAREKAHLQRVEQKNLEAQGVSASEARARAEQVAQAMVSAAAEIKKAPAGDPEMTVAPEASQTLPARPAAKAAPPRRVNVSQLMQVVEQPRPTKAGPAMRLDNLLAAPFGGGPRFLLACILLVCSGFWAWSQNLIPGSDALDQGSTWLSKYNEAKMKAGKINLPVTLPVPEIVSKSLFSVGALAAGVVLLLSSLWYSWKIGVLQYLATAILLLGPTLGLLPDSLLGFSPTDVSLMVGLAVSLLGFVFGRDT
jgi:serine/threonine protein kinase